MYIVSHADSKPLRRPAAAAGGYWKGICTGNSCNRKGKNISSTRAPQPSHGRK